MFEPHGGYGGSDPDGEPWPFGYITDVNAIMPLFEIAPIVCLDAEELHYAALKMAAAPQLLAVATRMLSYAQSGAAFNYPLGSLQELEIAVAKATGQAVSK